MLGESAREKGLDLVAACDATVPDIVCGDPVRFAQVLLNLTANAVKFTEAGEVVVRVSADRTGDRVRITVNVADTGIGIESDAMAGLFELFTQADASTTRVHGGTGLGLAISRELVCALGGEIGVESVPGLRQRLHLHRALRAPGRGRPRRRRRPRPRATSPDAGCSSWAPSTTASCSRRSCTAGALQADGATTVGRGDRRGCWTPRPRARRTTWC